MATAENVNDFVHEDPRNATISLPAGSVDTHALKLVLDALTTSYGIGGTNVWPVSLGRSFMESVYIYQAGHVIGAGKHVEHIAKHLRFCISKNLPTYGELDTILKCVPTTDSLFKHLANDLAHRRHKNSIPDTKGFEAFLEKRQVLKKEMEKIDARHQARLNALIVEKKKANEKQRKARKTQEQNKLQALKAKVGKGSGNVITLTAEQAELLRTTRV